MGVVLADRLDAEASVFGEWAYLLALEQLIQMSIPPRAQQIRVLLSEMSRVSSHLAYLTRMARACRFQTAEHFLLRDRERWLDLFELQTGVRFCHHFFRWGGVAHDVTDGFVERVLDACDLMQLRLKELRDLFVYHPAFMNRVTYLAVLPIDEAKKMGLSGPNLRASQEPFDIRKAHPYGVYSTLHWEIPVGRGEFGMPGDTHERIVIRVDEIAQSLNLMRQVCDQLQVGPYLEEVPKKVPPGEAFSRVESPRGTLACHLVSNGGETPLLYGQLKFQTGIPVQGHPVALGPRGEVVGLDTAEHRPARADHRPALVVQCRVGGGPVGLGGGRRRVA
jgi:NADH-quinone oxidoreductase subunit D